LATKDELRERYEATDDEHVFAEAKRLYERALAESASGSSAIAFTGDSHNQGRRSTAVAVSRAVRRGSSSSARMSASLEMREPLEHPWRGRQPKYERPVRLAPDRFGLVTKLPSGEPIAVPLGRRRATGGPWLAGG
jgi:hypothetical protein